MSFPDYHLRMRGKRVEVTQKGYAVKEYGSTAELIEDAERAPAHRIFVLDQAGKFLRNHRRAMLISSSGRIPTRPAPNVGTRPARRKKSLLEKLFGR